jgi:hypothetical protein
MEQPARKPMARRVLLRLRGRAARCVYGATRFAARSWARAWLIIATVAVTATMMLRMRATSKAPTVSPRTSCMRSTPSIWLMVGCHSPKRQSTGALSRRLPAPISSFSVCQFRPVPREPSLQALDESRSKKPPSGPPVATSSALKSRVAPARKGEPSCARCSILSAKATC